VRFVFHTDLPGSLEAYYQEIGRAGRDGAPAEAQMLFGLGDIRMRRMFIDDEDSSAEHKRRAHGRLATLIGFCETAACRRQILLRYFGETALACGNCDNCLNTAPRQDGTAEAKLILAAIAQTGGFFGPAHIVDVLRGGKTEKVLGRGHHLLAAFGAGAARRKEDWQSLIRQMVAAEFLVCDAHGGLAISPKGESLRRGEGGFDYRLEAAPAGARSKSRGAALAPMAAGDDELLAALKSLRLRLAKERRVAAFLIFSDRSLLDMAALRPRNRDEFALVHGVGVAKLQEFAAPFLKVIAAQG
jgi:ATP-dependent DNA helicase RecQ